MPHEWGASKIKVRIDGSCIETLSIDGWEVGRIQELCQSKIDNIKKEGWNYKCGTSHGQKLFWEWSTRENQSTTKGIDNCTIPNYVLNRNSQTKGRTQSFQK